MTPLERLKAAGAAALSREEIKSMASELTRLIRMPQSGAMLDYARAIVTLLEESPRATAPGVEVTIEKGERPEPDVVHIYFQDAAPGIVANSHSIIESGDLENWIDALNEEDP